MAGTVDVPPVVPPVVPPYSNVVLLGMRDTAKNELTKRKLNTEILLIKNKILGENSKSETHYLHTYTYDEINGTNNYVLDLLKNIKVMFPESVISVLDNYPSESSSESFSESKPEYLVIGFTNGDINNVIIDSSDIYIHNSNCRVVASYSKEHAPSVQIAKYIYYFKIDWAIKS
jgi:hypothetical protein